MTEAATPSPSAAQAIQKPSLDDVIHRCRFFNHWQQYDYRLPLPEPVQAVVLSNAAKLDAGTSFAHRLIEQRPGYDAQAIDTAIQTAQSTPCPLSCEAARTTGFAGCPVGRNCIKPTGFPAKHPADLGQWGFFLFKDIPHRIHVQAFIDFQFPHGLIYTQGQFWGYSNGAFDPLDEEVDVKQKMLAFFSDYATTPILRSLTSLLKTMVCTHPDVFAAEARFRICLSNGTFNLEQGALEAHSPDHRLQQRFNFAYDDEADCPAFSTFLDQVFRDDADKVQKIAFVQEWMGYLLVPDTSMQLMVCSLGDGANGKSVWHSVCRELVGRQNVFGASLKDISNKFTRAQLAGKTLNVSGDLPVNCLVDDGYIKAIVSGDVIEARNFNGQAFSFKPTVRLMAATNNLPTTKDLSDGFFRRMVILEFNRKFTGNDANPNLEHELVQELPGIFNFAVEGLHRLRQQGRFTIPPSSLRAVAAYRLEMDPVQQFAEECLGPSTDGSGYQGTELTKIFHAWAKDQGYPRATSITPQSFGRSMRRLGFEKRRSGREFWLAAPRDAALPWFRPAGTRDGRSNHQAHEAVGRALERQAA